MIKATVRVGAETYVVLGLSGENMTRLMAGEPILLNLAALGLPSQPIVIMGGKTEDDIAETLVKRLDANPHRK